MYSTGASLSQVLIVYYIIINLYGFLIMLYDKRKAQKEQRRVPEKTLFTIAACGGALGVFSGMYAFRHKTLHSSFVVGVPMLFLFNLVCIYLIYKYAI